MLIVDDILSLPGMISDIILKSIKKTVNATAWSEYQKQLNTNLIRAKYDRDSGKITIEQYRELEAYIFKEMRYTRKAIASNA